LCNDCNITCYYDARYPGDTLTIYEGTIWGEAETFIILLSIITFAMFGITVYVILNCELTF